jgi:hypothetical protein
MAANMLIKIVCPTCCYTDLVARQGDRVLGMWLSDAAEAEATAEASAGG